MAGRRIAPPAWRKAPRYAFTTALPLRCAAAPAACLLRTALATRPHHTYAQRARRWRWRALRKLKWNWAAGDAGSKSAVW